MISDERLMVIQAVAEGQLSAESITDEEITYMVESVAETILAELSERKDITVFWGEEQPTVH